MDATCSRSDDSLVPAQKSSDFLDFHDIRVPTSQPHAFLGPGFDITTVGCELAIESVCFVYN